jgi:hypothetical protein
VRKSALEKTDASTAIDSGNRAKYSRHVPLATAGHSLLASYSFLNMR